MTSYYHLDKSLCYKYNMNMKFIYQTKKYLNMLYTEVSC